MIWTVEYKQNWLFDIELYWDEITPNDYELELHVISSPSGFIDYTMEVLKYASTKLIERFKKDCDKIRELRGWLHEDFKYKHPKNKDERFDDNQKKLAYNYIESVLDEFKKNYSGLKIKID